MPFKSKAQQRFLFATRPKGVDLKEWSDATDYKKLPDKVATEHLEKRATLSSAIKNHGPMLGGLILGNVAGGFGAHSLMEHYAPDAPEWEQFAARGVGSAIGSGVAGQMADNIAKGRAPLTGAISAAAGHEEPNATFAEHLRRGAPMYIGAGLGAIGGGFLGHAIGHSIAPDSAVVDGLATAKGLGLGAALGGFAGEAVTDEEKREQLKDPVGLPVAALGLQKMLPAK